MRSLSKRRWFSAESAGRDFSKPYVQGLVSTTTGRRPRSLHAQSFSKALFKAIELALSNPFEENGVPQQVPATSGGRNTGLRARRDSSTKASIRLMSLGSPGRRPMTREMQLGK